MNVYSQEKEKKPVGVWLPEMVAYMNGRETWVLAWAFAPSETEISVVLFIQ